MNCKTCVNRFCCQKYFEENQLCSDYAQAQLLMSDMLTTGFSLKDEQDNIDNQ